MAVTNQDLEAVPPGATSSLLKGLSQLSNVIASRSGELAQLVQNVSQLTATLHQHGTQLFSLIGQSDLVLQVLNQRHAEIDQLLKSTASLTQQLEALLAAHQAQVGPLLSDLQTVSGVLAKDGNDIEAAIPLLTSANKYLANVTGSGAFGDFVMPAALIPDNVIAQCTKPGATTGDGVQPMRVSRGRLILAALAAGLLVVAVVAVFGIRAALSTPTYTVTADFTEAPGVYVGNHVDVLGDPGRDGDRGHAPPHLRAVVMQVDTDVKVPANAIAALMAPDLVNDRYIQLDPVYRHGAVMADNAVIPMQPDRVAAVGRPDDLAAGPADSGARADGRNKNGVFSRFVHDVAQTVGQQRPELPHDGPRARARHCGRSRTTGRRSRACSTTPGRSPARPPPTTRSSSPSPTTWPRSAR